MSSTMISKILLADDEKDIVDLIEEVLRQDNPKELEKAYTGAEALSICKEH